MLRLPDGPMRVLFVLCLLAAPSLSACAAVPAYDRGRLAHPTMDPSDAASPAMEHVHAIQEGAVGGTVGASSGCGCN